MAGSGGGAGRLAHGQKREEEEGGHEASNHGGEGNVGNEVVSYLKRNFNYDIDT